VTPVLELDELTADEHLAARGAVFDRAGAVEAAPAPRLSRTPGEAGPPPVAKKVYAADTAAES
jgi:alpha-methylacyl-CoA racemase